ncbi:flagellar FlbD family protein [Clostridium sp. Mt-5]|uniref:Flagellar FlbD family protein n=1 Tax=Clostridium moutaii TaxID=3240932 RepID=A0ABV4BKX9_9CLOT
MIKLTGLNDKEFVINADHIEKLTETPQSVITLTNGNKYIVQESNDEIIRRVIDYKRKIYRGDFK